MVQFWCLMLCLVTARAGAASNRVDGVSDGRRRIWHATDLVALRPEISFSSSASDPTSIQVPGRRARWLLGLRALIHQRRRRNQRIVLPLKWEPCGRCGAAGHLFESYRIGANEPVGLASDADARYYDDNHRDDDIHLVGHGPVRCASTTAQTIQCVRRSRLATTAPTRRRKPRRRPRSTSR